MRRNLNKYTAFFEREIVRTSMEIALKSLHLLIQAPDIAYIKFISPLYFPKYLRISFLHIPMKIYTLFLYIITKYINVTDYSAFKLIHNDLRSH